MMNNKNNKYLKWFWTFILTFFGAGHLQCPNNYSQYMFCNRDVHNYIKRIGLTSIPYSVGDVVSKKSRLECEVYCSMPLYITLCHARKIFVHSMPRGMSRVVFI